MKSCQKSFIIRKINIRKDNRAVIYLPLNFVISEYVKVEKRGNRIVIVPIK